MLRSIPRSHVSLYLYVFSWAVLLQPALCITEASDVWAIPWEDMAFKATWKIDSATYSHLVNDFPDGKGFGGYTLEVCWKNDSNRGISRKYTNTYYDSSTSDLSRSLHSLQHRTSYSSKPQAADNNLNTLLNLKTAPWCVRDVKVAGSNLASLASKLEKESVIAHLHISTDLIYTMFVVMTGTQLRN